MKLQTDDKIKAVGSPLFAQVNDGRIWTMYAASVRLGRNVYNFKCGKSHVAHYASDIDRWIGGTDNNRFEIVGR